MENFISALIPVLACLAVTTVCATSCTRISREETESAYVRAVEEYASGNLDRSMDSVEQICELDPKFLPSRFLLGKLRYFHGDTETALELFYKLVKDCPEYTEARLWRIRCLISLGEYDKAERILLEELAINSSDWRFYYQYAQLAEALNNFETQIGMLARAEAYLEESARVYLDQAGIWYGLDLENRSNMSLEKASVVSGKTGELGRAILHLKKMLAKGGEDEKEL
ncbi:MAG TPA: tetratricopeptide repeat protein [Treponema sp.]|nr:tetratricopeptide repeat protein [Treponema sp.]